MKKAPVKHMGAFRVIHGEPDAETLACVKRMVALDLLNAIETGPFIVRPRSDGSGDWTVAAKVMMIGSRHGRA